MASLLHFILAEFTSQVRQLIDLSHIYIYTHLQVNIVSCDPIFSSLLYVHLSSVSLQVLAGGLSTNGGGRDLRQPAVP